MSKRRKVFVYGTLRKGYGNHQGRLTGKDAKFLGTGKTKTKMNMIAHGYPMVTDEHSDDNDNFIIGELYEVDESTVLGPLDRLEGHPHLFTRKETPIVMDEDEKEETAWMYFYKHQGPGQWSGAVPSGDFTVFVKERNNR